MHLLVLKKNLKNIAYVIFCADMQDCYNISTILAIGFEIF